MQSNNPKLDLLKSKLSHLKRQAWKPIVQEGDGALTASKFSGKPWLNEDEQWPTCRTCGQPMQLCLQLNLQELTESISGKFGYGILQLFYCTSAQTNNNRFCVENEGWKPFVETCKLIRIIQPSGTPAEVEIPEIKYLSAAKLIVNWEEMDDYPTLEEVEIHGINLNQEEIETFWDADLSQQGDKLAGWPEWVQYPEYPNCPTCNQMMNQFIFQLESYDNLPTIAWGDGGAGYIVQCPEHKNQVAFLWQCA